MSYSTLEEAWGIYSFELTSNKRKSKKEKRLEALDKKMLNDAVDPQILIPGTPRTADNRKSPILDEVSSNIQGYDRDYMSMQQYQSYNHNPIKKTNENILISQERPKHSSLISEIETNADEFVKIKKKEYEQLKKRMIEGFGNQIDEQFNQLLLFIFTGIFYLFLLDMMYQLGKKSY